MHQQPLRARRDPLPAVDVLSSGMSPVCHDLTPAPKPSVSLWHQATRGTPAERVHSVPIEPDDGAVGDGNPFARFDVTTVFDIGREPMHGDVVVVCDDEAKIIECEYQPHEPIPTNVQLLGVRLFRIVRDRPAR